MKTAKLFIFILSVACIFNSCQKEMAVENALEGIPKYDTLTITSNPIGASIYINGRYSGYNTPAKIEWVEIGDLAITIKLPPFADKEINIPADSISTPQFFDFLTDDRNFGAIECTSVPSGADIFLNSKSLGKKTPFTIDWLRPGQYRVTYKLANHRADSSIVVVSARNDDPLYQNSKYSAKLKDTSLFVSYSTETGFSSCTKVFIDNQKIPWFYFPGRGIYRYERSVLKRIYSTSISGIVNVNCIFQDSRGNTWFGTDEGLIRITSEGESRVFKASTYPYKEITKVKTVCEDAKENIWFITDKGIISINLNSSVDDVLNWFTYTAGNSGIFGDIPIAITTSKDGSVWLSFYGSGISRYLNGRWTNYTTQNSSIPSQYVVYMYSNSDDVYFLCSTNIFRYSNGTWTGANFAPLYTNNGSYIDSENNIFSACASYITIYKNDGSSFYYSTKVPGYPEYFDAKSIGVDGGKNVWIASRNYGIIKLKFYNK